MYSVLRTQKLLLRHKKYSSITSSTFLTNTHVLFTFSDCSLLVYQLHLASMEKQKILFQGEIKDIAIYTKRLNQQLTIILCRHVSHVYVVKLVENHVENITSITIEELAVSTFANMINIQYKNGILNTVGCQFKLYTFMNGCFIIQYNIYGQKKIIYDCYKYRQIRQETALKKYEDPNENIQYRWQLQTIQILLQTNKYMISQPMNYNEGIMSIYKQEQKQNQHQILQIYFPFIQYQKNLESGFYFQQNFLKNVQKFIKIKLPEQVFNQHVAILQICQYLENSYMVVVSNRFDGKLSLYMMVGFQPKISMVSDGSEINFIQILQQKCQFLSDRFMRILYINPKDQIFYALEHAHVRINGQLYQNCLQIGNLRSGKEIERGYCTMKNIDFSPNYRYILDVPYDYENYGQSFYHIRVLLSKASLYMLIIEKCQMFNWFSDQFQQSILGFL